MDLPDYADVFALDTLMAIDEAINSTPSFAACALKDDVRGDCHDRVQAFHDSIFAVNSSTSRFMSPMYAIAHLPEADRQLAFGQLSRFLKAQGVSDIVIGHVIKVLVELPTITMKIVDALEDYDEPLAEVAFTKLGQDTWAFLVTGFAPDALRELELLDLLEEGTSDAILNLITDVIMH